MIAMMMTGLEKSSHKDFLFHIGRIASHRNCEYFKLRVALNHRSMKECDILNRCIYLEAEDMGIEIEGTRIYLMNM
jgi:hypothetical protein